jgi:hypothetical protein
LADRADAGAEDSANRSGRSGLFAPAETTAIPIAATFQLLGRPIEVSQPLRVALRPVDRVFMGEAEDSRNRDPLVLRDRQRGAPIAVTVTDAGNNRRMTSVITVTLEAGASTI